MFYMSAINRVLVAAALSAVVWAISYWAVS